MQFELLSFHFSVLFTCGVIYGSMRVGFRRDCRLARYAVQERLAVSETEWARKLE